MLTDPDASSDDVEQVLSLLISEESVLLKDPCTAIHVSRSIDTYRLHAPAESGGRLYQTVALYGFWRDKLRMEILLDPSGRLKCDNAGNIADFAGAIGYALAGGSTLFAWHSNRVDARQALYRTMEDPNPSPARDVARKMWARGALSLNLSADAARRNGRALWMEPQNVMTRTRDADFVFARWCGKSAWSALNSGWYDKICLLESPVEVLRKNWKSSAAESASGKQTSAQIMFKEPLVFVDFQHRRKPPISAATDPAQSAGGSALAAQLDRWPIARFTLSQEGGQVMRIFSPPDSADPPDPSQWKSDADKVYREVVHGERTYDEPRTFRPWMYNHFGIGIDPEANREDAVSVVSAWLDYAKFDASSDGVCWELHPSFYLSRISRDFALHRDSGLPGHVLTALCGFVDNQFRFEFLLDANGLLGKTPSGNPADYAGALHYAMCVASVMFTDYPDCDWMAHAITALSRDCKDPDTKGAAKKICARNDSSGLWEPVVVRFRGRTYILNPGSHWRGVTLLADALYCKRTAPDIWAAFKRELPALKYSDGIDAAMDALVESNAKDLHDKKWSRLRRITDQPLVCGAPLDVYDSQIGGRSLIEKKDSQNG